MNICGPLPNAAKSSQHDAIITAGDTKLTHAVPTTRSTTTAVAFKFIDA